MAPKRLGLADMILGIGVDLVDSRRIEKAIDDLGQKFLDRVFTQEEQAFCQNRTKFIQSFSKVFAAKEAVLKAISHTQGIHWQHIQIKHLPSGKPYVELTEKALVNYQELVGVGGGHIHLSITDDPPYAQAFVVIEGKNPISELPQHLPV
jgi:holo-[acyl-carrier protein] synthase